MGTQDKKQATSAPKPTTPTVARRTTYGIELAEFALELVSRWICDMATYSSDSLNEKRWSAKEGGRGSGQPSRTTTGVD